MGGWRLTWLRHSASATPSTCPAGDVRHGRAVGEADGEEEVRAVLRPVRHPGGRHLTDDQHGVGGLHPAGGGADAGQGPGHQDRGSDGEGEEGPGQGGGFLRGIGFHLIYYLWLFYVTLVILAILYY